MIGALVTIRTASKRFPGKAVAELAGKPMVVRCIENAQRLVDKVVVATTKSPEDNKLAEISKEAGALVYRGAIHDVFRRQFGAMKKHELTYVLNISGDCPFMDDYVALSVKKAVVENPGYDYYSPYITYRNMVSETITVCFALSYYEKALSVYKLIPKRMIMEIEGSWGTWLGDHIGKTVLSERHTRFAVELEDRYPWADTVMKLSIDWPLELAVANRIVEHIGHYPHDVTEIYNAYREIKKL